MYRNCVGNTGWTNRTCMRASVRLTACGQRTKMTSSIRLVIVVPHPADCDVARVGPVEAHKEVLLEEPLHMAVAEEHVRPAAVDLPRPHYVFGAGDWTNCAIRLTVGRGVSNRDHLRWKLDSVCP